jgi:hypothetical protein
LDKRKTVLVYLIPLSSRVQKLHLKRGIELQQMTQIELDPECKHIQTASLLTDSDILEGISSKSIANDLQPREATCEYF